MLCVEQSRGAPAESGSARRGADGTCWKLLIKALSHLLLLCPSLCLWGAVKGVLKEDKPMPCVCVCVWIQNCRSLEPWGHSRQGDGAVSLSLAQPPFLPP